MLAAISFRINAVILSQSHILSQPQILLEILKLLIGKLKACLSCISFSNHQHPYRHSQTIGKFFILLSTQCASRLQFVIAQSYLRSAKEELTLQVSLFRDSFEKYSKLTDYWFVEKSKLKTEQLNGSQ